MLSVLCWQMPSQATCSCTPRCGGWDGAGRGCRRLPWAGGHHPPGHREANTDHSPWPWRGRCCKGCNTCNACYAQEVKCFYYVVLTSRRKFDVVNIFSSCLIVFLVNNWKTKKKFFKWHRRYQNPVSTKIKL